MPKSVQNFFQTPNEASKIAQDFCFLAKWRNFAKSSHTDPDTRGHHSRNSHWLTLVQDNIFGVGTKIRLEEKGGKEGPRAASDCHTVQSKKTLRKRFEKGFVDKVTERQRQREKLCLRRVGKFNSMIRLCLREPDFRSP